MATDEDLLLQVGAGDRGVALAELYDRFERRLYGFGRRLLTDPGLAEELVQDTFVRLWRSAGRFDPSRGSAETFVFTVARHLAVDLWRRRSSRPLDVQATSEIAGPSSAVDSLLVELAVREALDGLPQAQRQVLELAYQDGLSQTEIADRIGVPLGTVKTRTYHGLRAMKSVLEERAHRG